MHTTLHSLTSKTLSTPSSGLCSHPQSNSFRSSFDSLSEWFSDLFSRITPHFGHVVYGKLFQLWETSRNTNFWLNLMRNSYFWVGLPLWWIMTAFWFKREGAGHLKFMRLLFPSPTIVCPHTSERLMESEGLSQVWKLPIIGVNFLFSSLPYYTHPLWLTPTQLPTHPIILIIIVNVFVS